MCQEPRGGGRGQLSALQIKPQKKKKMGETVKRNDSTLKKHEDLKTFLARWSEKRIFNTFHVFFSYMF